MPSLSSRLPLLLYGTLLCSSFAPLPVISSTARDEEYLLGIKRLRRLYCNVGIGFHIQVLPSGKITGVHNENRYSKWFISHQLVIRRDRSVVLVIQVSVWSLINSHVSSA